MRPTTQPRPESMSGRGVNLSTRHRSQQSGGLQVEGGWPVSPGVHGQTTVFQVALTQLGQQRPLPAAPSPNRQLQEGPCSLPQPHGLAVCPRPLFLWVQGPLFPHSSGPL